MLDSPRSLNLVKEGTHEMITILLYYLNDPYDNIIICLVIVWSVIQYDQKSFINFKLREVISHISDDIVYFYTWNHNHYPYWLLICSSYCFIEMMPDNIYFPISSGL